MNRIPFAAVCACCAVFSSPVIAGPGHGGHDKPAHAEADADKPVNAICPIGEEPVEADGGRVVYKGKTIGFCCPGCIGRFNAWEESKKDEFVAMSMISSELGMEEEFAKKASDAKEPTERIGDPYLLSVCPVSGGKLGGMGDPVVKLYDGREVKFCCKMCLPKFEKDLKASFKKLDQQIIDSQLPFYPTTECVVSGDSLGDEEMGDIVDYVYNNRLVRLCCKMCKSDFKADPDSFIAKLDKEVIAQQDEKYPLDSCPISGGKLGSMGKPVSVVYGGRLVKFCCKMCIPKFEANPAPVIEKIDAAWMAMHKDG